ncbi:MAG: hypothetical protein Q9201_000940 [Fulgogasparrea decipioides]
MPRLRLTEATLDLKAASISTASSGCSIETWMTKHPSSPALYAPESEGGTEKCWVHLVPSPLELSHGQGSPSESKVTKRPHPSAPPTGPISKRPKLAPTSGNRGIQSPPPETTATPMMNKRRSQRTKGKENDARQGRLPPTDQACIPATPSPGKSHCDALTEDLPADVTPRGRPTTLTSRSHLQRASTTGSPIAVHKSTDCDTQNPFESAPTFPVPEIQNRQPSTKPSKHYGTKQTDASTRVSSESSPSRSKSPSKEGNDLQRVDVPVDFIEFGTPGYPLTPEARDLRRDIVRLGHSSAVIPEQLKSLVIGFQVDECDDDRELLEESCGIAGSGPTANGPAPTTEDIDLLKRTIAIRKNAMRCRNTKAAEPEWNSAVHYPLIQLALEGYWDDAGIWFHDVTTARISDSSLLPGLAVKAKRNQSKMVDYSMIIRPSEHTLERIKQRIIDANDFSINQSDAEYLRFQPISVNVETKRAAISELTANTQLATWVFAQFEKLERLRWGISSIPILPLIMVQGHEWKLLMAHKATPKQVIIYRDLKIGETASLPGIFQVLATLKRLARWTNEEYRTWFENNVL